MIFDNSKSSDELSNDLKLKDLRAHPYPSPQQPQSNNLLTPSTLISELKFSITMISSSVSSSASASASRPAKKPRMGKRTHAEIDTPTTTAFNSAEPHPITTHLRTLKDDHKIVALFEASGHLSVIRDRILLLRASIADKTIPLTDAPASPTQMADMKTSLKEAKTDLDTFTKALKEDDHANVDWVDDWRHRNRALLPRSSHTPSPSPETIMVALIGNTSRRHGRQQQTSPPPQLPPKKPPARNLNHEEAPSDQIAESPSYTEPAEYQDAAVSGTPTASKAASFQGRFEALRAQGVPTAEAMHWARAVVVAEEEEAKWRISVGRLESFRDKFQHCCVPIDWNDDGFPRRLPLGQWVANQIRQVNLYVINPASSTLTAEHIHDLHRVGAIYSWRQSKLVEDVVVEV